ncbi:MAG TPA: serine hydrolase domain-containing protein [Mucilaginibacter sp.]|nr:serine hydrolase domain-containing protein [Mucilaginibacter sp.]
MKISVPLLIATSFAILSISCKKTTVNPASPATPTTPTTPQTYDFSAVDKELDDSVPVKFGGKCYALIDINGKDVYTKSYGGYTGDTRELIASCSKWLSAGVLMSLVDEGKLKLTDTVGKFLPDFTKYHKGNITIAQLFSHTSGFPGNSTQGYESNPFLTLAQAADSIAKNVPLLAAPGKQFYYGGVSMQVAGRVCEVVSGESWAGLFQQKIAGPLGMTNTDYGLTSNPGIAGGARSTANDYIKYLNMIMNEGVAADGTRILSQSAIAAMEQGQTANVKVAYTPYPLVLLQNNDFYAIGNWRDVTGANDVLIEDSSPGAFGAHPWVDRSRKVTGIIFTYIPVNGYLATIWTCLDVRKIVRGIVPQ